MIRVNPDTVRMDEPKDRAGRVTAGGSGYLLQGPPQFFLSSHGQFFAEGHGGREMTEFEHMYFRYSWNERPKVQHFEGTSWLGVAGVCYVPDWQVGLGIGCALMHAKEWPNPTWESVKPVELWLDKLNAKYGR